MTPVFRLVLLAAALSLPAAAQPLITTVAGTDFVFKGDGQPALNAPMGGVAGITADASGNLYFVDQSNSMVMKVTPDGVLHVIAGNGIAGFSGDGGPATSAAINSGGGLAVDPAGNIYVADSLNSRVRKISPDGIITTVAGSHTCVDNDNVAACHGGDGGLAINALLNVPISVRLDSAGNLYIVDISDNRVRKVSPSGVITTFAGNGDDGGAGDGGLATQASLISPLDAVFDSRGNLYILQRGKLSVVALNGRIGSVELPDDFRGLAIDSSDSLYLADWVDEVILKIPQAGETTIVAGSGTPGFGGDGGPATKAQLTLGVFSLAGMAIDSAGSLYFSDLDNFRVRKVTPDGIVNTIAGNGQYGYSGDGGPAIQATFGNPYGVTIDGAGSLYIPDGPANRVRKITPDGTITTVAGNGSPGFTGDGGPAVAASLYYPVVTAVDTIGNLYVVDALSRVRRVSPDGMITTIAGNGGILAGVSGDQFTGDTGPALQADLGLPISELGLAVDAAGNVYIAETLNHRVRKVTPDGLISTFAGKNGELNQPIGLAVDAAGNLYIADNGQGVKKVTLDGTISTVATLEDAVGVAVDPAGNLYATSGQQVFQISVSGALTPVAGTGATGYSGDGGPATMATLHFPYNNESSTSQNGIAFDEQGNLYISDGENRRIRMVLAAPPAIRTDLRSLAFTGNANGAPALAQQITVSGAIPLIGVSLAVKTADGGDWLSVSTTSGLTPLLVDVSANPVKLAPGAYQGTLLITAANASPQQLQITVTFNVGPGLPARLALDPDHLSFNFPVGSFSRSQAVAIFNAGGGSLAFTASAELDTAKQTNWLTLSAASATVTPAAPVPLNITANAAGLAAGVYRARIMITSAASPAPTVVPVTMTVSAKPLSLLLSQSGLSFTAVAGGGVVPPQTFGVLGIGSGASPFTVESSTLSGGNWLSVTPSSGMLASGGTAPVVTVSVNQQGLAPGRYYGLVRTRASATANTPQALTVFVDVQEKDTDLAAVIRPNELVFTAPAGESSPGAQEALVYNLTGTAKSFLAVSSVMDGDPVFFHVLPTDGIVQPDAPTRILVQPSLGVTGQSNSLAPGTHRGTLTLQFSDGRVRNLGITFIVTPAVGATISSKGRVSGASETCVPNTLIPALSSLGTGFTVPAGWPLALQVDVRDNCGAALLSGAVVAEFSNGDPPLSLKPLASGRWEGTWQTRGGQGAAVSVTVKARTALGDVTGAKQVSGGLGSSQAPPVIANDGVVNAASMTPQQPLAPGSAITILGSQLAEGQASYSTVPIGTELAGATVLIADLAAPLVMADPQHIRAIIPYGIEVNTTHQVLVQRGLTYSQPIDINVAAAQPVIFNKGGTQGWIVDARGTVAGPGNAAAAGDSVTIFCTGLGEVTPAVSAGSAGPALPGATAVNPVSATIGNVNATVKFAGLAPTLVGMYQVQAVVPTGVAPNDAAPVTVTTGGAVPQTSPAVTMPVR